MRVARHTLPPRRRWKSGMLTCAALFALGGVLLWGLFLAPRAKAPASPDAQWGVPRRPIRVVSLDLEGSTRGVQEAAALLKAVDPDYVLAQRVPGDAVVPLAEALGMQRSFHPKNFVRHGKGTSPGCLVLSKHPVYDATPLRPGSPADVALGVWATSVLDGRRFAVASADFGPKLSGAVVSGLAAAAALNARQKSAGDPPLVVALRIVPTVSARAEILRASGLTDVSGLVPDPPGDVADGPLVAVKGPWKVSLGRTSAERRLAPGVLWAEVDPE